MAKSSHNSIEANSIGSTAYEVLAKDQTAEVKSSTSKGIYINSASRWLVFLSFEDYHSPLTITLKDELPLPSPIPIGAKVDFSSGDLLIPTAGIRITVDDQSVWKPAGRQNDPGIFKERKKRLNYIAETALFRKSSAGFSPLLPDLLKMPMEKHPPYQALIPLYGNIILIQQSIREGRLALAGDILSKFLGFGEGLTPSGDDYVCGVLLSLNRWKDVLVPKEDLESLNQQVLETAYQVTTTLSANLIECAARGEGDERLIRAVDFLMCGGGQEDEVVTDLLNWGSSSGVDTFVGMASVLSVID